MSTASPTLVRPESQRVIGGVCAAIANRFGWNLAVVRVLTVVAALFTGVALFVYLAFWIAVPSGA